MASGPTLCESPYVMRFYARTGKFFAIMARFPAFPLRASVNLLSHKSRLLRWRVRIDLAESATKGAMLRKGTPLSFDLIVIQCNLINLFQHKNHPCGARGNASKFYKTLIMVITMGTATFVASIRIYTSRLEMFMHL